jgi:RimJ/RimL family protein N-acetyltransferase
MTSSTFSIPRLTTSRLQLRELRVEDFDAYAADVADPVAMTHTLGAVDRRTAWRLFASLSGLWALTGAGWWAVENRDTDTFVGIVGGFFRETALPVGPDTDLELGWSILRPFWRQGFAKETARAALAWGFQQHGVARAVAHIAPANLASIAVAEAVGMTCEGDVDFYGEKIRRYAVRRV